MKFRSPLLLAFAGAYYAGAFDSKLALQLTAPERAAKPKSTLEQRVVQPRYTAMKARTKR